jgi:hypothetical protein
MNQRYISLCIAGLGILGSALVVSVSLAQTLSAPPDAGIQYPIAELGNCKNKDACKTYCDNSANVDACLAFAEKNGLMTKTEIGTAKKFLSAGGKGPGGCTGRDSCETYCNDIDHINECVAFAEKTSMLAPDELAKAKQVQAAIAKGVKPPPCKNKKTCDVYCDEPANMNVCIAFGEAAGFLQGRELADAKKIVAAIDNGATPPPCRGKDACDVYCSASEHMEACIAFAQAAGFMSRGEMENSQKVLDAIKKGVKPPVCRGKEECDKYCSEDAHIDECANFSVAAGLMSEKDAKVAKKIKGKGPGGCVGKEQCDAFCGVQDNQETCINFAKENGLISPGELQKIEDGQKQFQESLQNMPQKVFTCLQNSIGSGTLEKFKSGQAMPSRDIGKQMGQCFSQTGGPPREGKGVSPGKPEGQNDGEETRPQQQGGSQGGFPNRSGKSAPGSFVGPGGCKTPEECKVFCQSNLEVCKNFRPPGMGSGASREGQEPQGQMQPTMPRQDQNGPNQGSGGMMPPNDERPLLEGTPLNGMMPPYPSNTGSPELPSTIPTDQMPNSIPLSPPPPPLPPGY